MNARAITLKQPWASLVACGAKTIIDQAKPTDYRGPLLIHAGKQRSGILTFAQMDALGAPSIAAPGESIGGGRVRFRGPDLPLGAVVASCRLVDCVPIDEIRWSSDGPRNHRGDTVVTADEPTAVMLHAEDGDLVERLIVHESQRPRGGFPPGCYAWLLEDAKATSERCPRCWGDGRAPCEPFACPCHEPEWCADVPGVGCDLCQAWHGDLTCPTCAGTKTCPPVPMRGHQGLWTPTWETT